MSPEIGTILVTGGYGFIGSNLIQRLSRTGAQVVVLDLQAAPTFPPNSGERGTETADDVEFIVGDIRDRSLCRRAMNGVDAVVHLAAESGIPPSVEDPERNFSVNVDGTLSLLLAAKEVGVRQFILASVWPRSLDGMTLRSMNARQRGPSLRTAPASWPPRPIA